MSGTKTSLNNIQELLDLEAEYSNSGLVKEKEKVQTLIRLQRGPAPECLGFDDCEVTTLIRCPWRMDCGQS